jgi:alkyldihydroxyacetonephosphate synthase
MQRMNRILWIDPANRMARIQAGAVGRRIADQLEEYGFTMGHEPDSVEFSTLGGWVATHASGMKKNRYGNIEDLVLDVHVATPHGVLERSGVAPRESVGVDPRRWIYGSEGNLGIITSAVIKIFPLPEVQSHGSVIFPSYEDGIAFMYDLARDGNLPASVRLVDNMQFQFSMALKPASSGLRAIKSRAQKWFATRLLGYDPQRMVACTLLFEGNRPDVSRQQATVYRIARRHGGSKAGAENGRRGYQLTFSIAYIRDFIMNHFVLGESFETSVPWNRILDVCKAVGDCIEREHEERELPGRPFYCSRVTQIYQTGVCVYFYYGIGYEGVENPSHVYAEIEAAVRHAILRAGGSLSHHHGIGKLRQEFLPKIMSPAVREWNRRTKQAIDPENVFGSRNQGVLER